MSGIPAGAGSLLGKRLGKYDILALLALGGTAEIYLARIDGTAGFEKYVVVKCLHDHLADDPDFVKMFLDEARLAAILDHSNIVQTFELGEHEGRYYMVMEFLAGLSLAMVVRRAVDRVADGKIPIPLIINIAAQVASGLHYAHDRTSSGKPLNIVHRDISPQNLVIGFEGVVKIVDFGIARAELRETKTKAGTIKGKFAYMSPEQCVASNVDRRTDVFALGVIVHELVTGRRLFKRNSPYETYQSVLECNVPSPSSQNPEIDPELDAIIMKAVARDKDARWPTAEALGDALLGYLHHHAKGSGAGEIGRFLDAHFQLEIEEHGERMRELIAGRDAPVDSWSDEDDKKANEALDMNGRAATSDDRDLSLETFKRGSTDTDAGSDDGPPPEQTRIEANPLELLKELDAGVASPAEVLPATTFPRPHNDTRPGPAIAPTAAAAPVAVMPAAPQGEIYSATSPSMIQPLSPLFPHSYPVVQGGRPYSTDLAPSTLPSTPASDSRRPSMRRVPNPRPTSSWRSPVGEPYHAADRNAASTKRGRALLPWQLALLFVGALGFALMLTMIVAKIVR